MKNKTFWILAVILVVLIIGASIAYNRLAGDAAPQQLNTQPPETTQSAETLEETTEATEAATYPAPEFTVYDKEGNAVNFSQFVGKPIVLNFWATWCGPCKLEMPDFNEKYEELGGEVVFLMINATDGLRETVEIADAYVTEQGFTFPVYFDTQSDAATTYGIRAFPTSYFIDKDGNLIANAVGAIDAETLQRGIDMIYTP